jgi:hypothetical protein
MEYGIEKNENEKGRNAMQPPNEMRPSYLLLAAAFLEIQSHHLIRNMFLRNCQEEKGSRSQ